MRVFFAAVVAAVAAPGAAHAAPNCAGAVPSAPAGLPSPVAVTTVCGVYTVSAAGTVSVGPARTLQAPPTDRTFLGRRGRHVVLISDGRIIWQSQRSFPRSLAVGNVALTLPDIAFSFQGGRRLWVARLGRAEQPVALNESPYAWTANRGLLTTRWIGPGDLSSLLVRTEDGSHPRLIAARARMLTFDDATQTLWFFSRGALVRSDGRTTTTIAKLSALGMGRNTYFELLDSGLIAVAGENRIAILRRDGSVFAASDLSQPRGVGTALELTGRPVVAADTVAFAVGEVDGGGLTPVEHVFVLHAGDTKATEVLRTRVEDNPCGRYAGLEWNGDWLLYTDGERATAIDTTDAGRSVDLSAFLLGLPGVGLDEEGSLSGLGDVAWAG
ncbi:MAG: hypothetical protein WBB74_12995 [Gaiellaceae bacterium]